MKSTYIIWHIKLVGCFQGHPDNYCLNKYAHSFTSLNYFNWKSGAQQKSLDRSIHTHRALQQTTRRHALTIFVSAQQKLSFLFSRLPVNILNFFIAKTKATPMDGLESVWFHKQIRPDPITIYCTNIVLVYINNSYTGEKGKNINDKRSNTLRKEREVKIQRIDEHCTIVRMYNCTCEWSGQCT